MSEPIRSEGVPHDRLTRITDAMAAAMEAHPEYHEGSDKCIIFMDSDVEKVGGLAMFGYEDDDGADAMAAIFSHLTAVFKSNGMTLSLIPVPEVGQG